MLLIKQCSVYLRVHDCLACSFYVGDLFQIPKRALSIFLQHAGALRTGKMAVLIAVPDHWRRLGQRAVDGGH
jgi:hypothetical protein